MFEQLEARSDYEAWHDSLEVDSKADTPWHSMVKQHLQPNRDLVGKRVLEIACGRGGFACWLMSQPQRPSELVAADFAATAVHKGRCFANQLGLYDIQWETADIQAIDHPAESFDTVISCETIEHVPSPRQALSELARVLKPGGRLFLTAPNYLSLSGLYRTYVRLRGRTFSEAGQPINHCLLLPQTRRWVVQTGLRIILIDGIGHYLPFPRGSGIELSQLNNPVVRVLMRWLGVHSMIVAEKPAKDPGETSYDA
jgi:2-polyprenyl-3-methyl-5-hydroxy-6-metoxy-1,4-benzoquinol methylase